MASESNDPTRREGAPDRGHVTVGHHARGIAVVTMTGAHDLGTHPRVADALERAAAHSNVVVDLSSCSFVDSTILKQFLKVSAAVRAGGERFILVIPPTQTAVTRVARIVALDELVEIRATTDEAYASLAQGARDDETA
jgi:anti-anti-sigma factor